MKETIMVVDDHKDIRLAFKKTLELAGYRVLTASSGKKCMEELKKEKPDLVLLDILMPKMDGVTTLKRIRELYPSLRVVIITVVGSEKTKDRTVKLGIEGYIVKPVGKRELLDAVISILSEV